MTIPLSLVFSLLALFTASVPRSVDVEVTTPSSGGKVYLAVYDSPEAFDKQEVLADNASAVGGSLNSVVLNLNLPDTGQYVFAAFQDLNNNGKLDRSLFGVPNEPYGFARNPPSKWRAPRFAEVATELADGVPSRLKISLRRWREY